MKKTVFSRCILAALLAAFLLSAAACGAATPEETGTAGPEVTTTEEDLLFPDADFGGDEFPVYFRKQHTDHYRGIYIIPDEDSADVIDQEAMTRNIRTEEKYHIRFQGIEVDTPSNTLKTDIASGNTPYYLILDMRRLLGPMGRSGLLTNFHDLDVDLTTDWWDRKAAEQYDVDGRLYCMPNDVSVSNLAGAGFLYFNKAVLEDYQLTSPYDYALADTWTIDRFFTMVKSVSNEGAAGELGVYGFLDSELNSVFELLAGIGVPRVERDADGILYCSIGDAYAERTSDFLGRFKTLVEDKRYCQNYSDVDTKDAAGASAYATYFMHARGMFKENHFLFTVSDMDSAARKFVDMPKGFGVIMNPKYDTNQEEYCHKMDNNSLIWAIPNDPGIDLEEVGLVMDHWAYTSHSTVMEAFYELTVKTKRASDPVTAQMLDTIKGSICYFTTDLYKVEAIDTMLEQAYSGSLANAWQSSKTGINRLLAKITEDIQQND